MYINIQNFLKYFSFWLMFLLLLVVLVYSRVLLCDITI